MKVEFTDKKEIEYIKQLVQDDVNDLKKKIKNREKILTNIFFAEERGDF